MKKTTVEYFCDYCKQKIDKDSDTVHALLPGRMSVYDEFLACEDDLHHCHDECMEALLEMTFSEPEPEPEPAPEPKKEKAPSIGSFVQAKKRPKDLGALRALLNAGWKQKDIAIEFGVSESAISHWVSELKKKEQEEKQDEALHGEN